MNRTLVNKVEAEAQLGVSQRTIYTLAKEKKINKYFVPKYRKTFMVCLEEVQDYLKNKECK